MVMAESKSQKDEWAWPNLNLKEGIELDSCGQI